MTSPWQWDTPLIVMTSSPSISLRWAQTATDVLIWIEGMSTSVDMTPRMVVDTADGRSVTLCGMWGKDCVVPVDKLCVLQLHAAVQARAVKTHPPGDDGVVVDGAVVDGAAYGVRQNDGSIAFRLPKVDHLLWWTRLTDGADPRVRARSDWDHWTPPPDSQDMDDHVDEK
jgi:hypothetical protein